MKTTDIKSLTNDPTDPRLRDEDFKQKVRIVFDYFGIQNNMKNFKHYDKIIDWIETARGIEHPIKRTLVKPLWNGEPVEARAYIIEGEFNEEKYKVITDG